MAVVSAVKIYVWADIPLGQVCREICKTYQNDFPGDINFEKEIEETAKQLLEIMHSQFTEEQLPSAMTQLQYLIKNYKLDGKKKRMRILGGTRFTRSKLPNPNRSENCIRNLLVYHAGTMSGMFPVAPSGWSL